MEEDVKNIIKTVYGYIEGNKITEIPTGYTYIVKANYLKSKPTFFNIGLDWINGDYSLISIYDFEKDCD